MKRCSLFSRVEVKRCSLFSRVGGEKMFTVQQGWRRRDVYCSARLSLRKKIKDGERLERLNGTDFILPPLLGILNLTNLK